MSVNLSFVELFNKVTNPSFANKETKIGSFEVKEYNTGDSLVPLSLLRVEQNDTEFTSFNHCLVHEMKDITEKRTSIIHDSDCDGIAFVNHGTSDGLILVELKSQFSTKKIKDAFSQMICSFLKLHAMLSLCKNYSIDSISIQFIAACQCFEDEIQEDGVYNRLNMAERSAKATFEGSFMRKLIEKHNIEVKLGDVTDLWGVPLNSSLTNKQLTLSLQMTKKYGDTSAVYVM